MWLSLGTLIHPDQKRVRSNIMKMKHVWHEKEKKIVYGQLMHRYVGHIFIEAAAAG